MNAPDRQFGLRHRFLAAEFGFGKWTASLNRHRRQAKRACSIEWPERIADPPIRCVQQKANAGMDPMQPRRQSS
jgi:hypothetical protein